MSEDDGLHAVRTAHEPVDHASGQPGREQRVLWVWLALILFRSGTGHVTEPAEALVPAGMSGTASPT